MVVFRLLRTILRNVKYFHPSHIVKQLTEKKWHDKNAIFHITKTDDCMFPMKRKKTAKIRMRCWVKITKTESESQWVIMLRMHRQTKCGVSFRMNEVKACECMSWRAYASVYTRVHVKRRRLSQSSACILSSRVFVVIWANRSLNCLEKAKR